MKIIEVTDLISDIENLNDNIPKHKATVMVYTMKNCPHCVNLKPKWDGKNSNEQRRRVQ